MEDKIMVRLDRELYKKLQIIKIQDGYRSISDVISMMVDKYEKK